MTHPSTTRETPSVRELATSAAAATTAALAGASATYALARLAGLDLDVTAPGQTEAGPVPFAAVVGAVVVSGLVALVGALVLRRVRRGRGWFLGLGSLALLGSFASPVGAASQTSTAVVLSIMHVLVAAFLLPVLGRRLGRGAA